MGYTEIQKGHLLDDRGYKFLQSLRTSRPLTEGEKALHQKYAVYTKSIGIHENESHELSDVVRLTELGARMVQREKSLRCPGPIRRALSEIHSRII